jgi:hypothetical protein
LEQGSITRLTFIQWQSKRGATQNASRMCKQNASRDKNKAGAAFKIGSATEKLILSGY